MNVMTQLEIYYILMRQYVLVKCIQWLKMMYTVIVCSAHLLPLLLSALISIKLCLAFDSENRVCIIYEFQPFLFFFRNEISPLSELNWQPITWKVVNQSWKYLFLSALFRRANFPPPSYMITYNSIGSL